MKKLIFPIVLMFLGITIQPAFSTSANILGPSISEDIMECSIQADPDLVELLIPIFEEMGVEVHEMKIVDETNAKSCTVRIVGTYNGKEIDITITFEGVSCAELLKQMT